MRLKDVQEAYRLLPGRAASDRLTQMAKAMEIELADQTSRMRGTKSGPSKIQPV